MGFFFHPKGSPARPGDERRRRSLRKTAARDRGPAPRPRRCRCAGVFRYTVHIIPIRLVKPARDASDAPPQEEGGGVSRSGSILLSHIISDRPSKQSLMVRTFQKVYMELGSYFLFLQEQIKDIIISYFNIFFCFFITGVVLTHVHTNVKRPELPREITPFCTARLLDCQKLFRTQYTTSISLITLIIVGVPWKGEVVVKTEEW
jgi:hypothetical protein